MASTILDRPPLSWDRRELDLLQVRIKDYTDRNAAVFFEMDELPARAAVPSLVLDHNNLPGKKLDKLNMYEQEFFSRLAEVRDDPDHAPGWEELDENVLCILTAAIGGSPVTSKYFCLFRSNAQARCSQISASRRGMLLFRFSLSRRNCAWYVALFSDRS